MHMILIRTYFQELDPVSLLNFQTYPFQSIINLIVQYSTPVLGWKYQVVHQYRNLMAFMPIFAHPCMLRRKRRGIEPEGINRRLSGFDQAPSVMCVRRGHTTPSCYPSNKLAARACMLKTCGVGQPVPLRHSSTQSAKFQGELSIKIGKKNIVFGFFYLVLTAALGLVMIVKYLW